MNVMNTSGDEFPECPLCMEPLEVDDLNFYPCTCGYQICRFCWHRIRTDENELCPACRKAYPENPADFTPLTQEQISALKAEKRQRDQQRKQKITENRKHLANVRVVQKNLVFVVGLPPRLADPEILKKHEYFGKYGKIHKVVINPSTAYAGVQVKGPSASAYVTYLHNNDALRAIQSVNNIAIDGRSIKTSLGTTKYCSHFMKNQSCPKPDCMYLHELGDPEASFTKEEMHQGKHQEYEKRLHDSLIAQMQQQAANPTSTVITNATVTPASTPPLSGVQVSANGNGVGTSIKYSDVKDSNSSNGPIQGKDAWPSLSISPSPKESKVKNGVNGSNSKENLRNEANRKHDKSKVEKGRKNHQKISNHVNQNNSKTAEKQHTKPHLLSNNSEEDFNEIEDSDSLSQEDRKAVDSPTISTTDSGDSGTVSESDSGKSSPGTFPDHPNTMQQHSNLINSTAAKAPSNGASASQEQISNFTSVLEMQQHDLDHNSLEAPPALGGVLNMNGLGGDANEISSSLYSNADKLNGMKLTNHSNNLGDPSSRMSKLNLFNENDSFFSRSLFNMSGDQNIANSQLPDLLSGTLHNNINSDDPAKQLLKNLGGFGSSHATNGSGDNSSDDWETAFKYLMKNNVTKQAEEQQQEEWLRLQEMRKHTGQNMHNPYNNFNDYYHNNHPTDMSRGPPGSLFNQHSQPQQARHNMPHGDLGHVYAGNMSKFFDFHKNQQQNQQQQSQQQFMMNGHSNPLTEQLNMSNMMDNSRVNSNFGDHSSGILSHLHKQRMMNKFEQPTSAPSNMVLHNNQQNRLQHSQYSNQSVEDDLGFDPFTESQKKLAELISNEEVQQQQQLQQQQNNSSAGNMQRTRMPPPGFNHLQANNNYGGGFGGVPRTQQQTGSKLLPFVNMPNNAQLQQPPTNWSMHMGFQQPSPAEQSHLGQSQQQQNGPHKADWTSLDPAIVSFRQFPQYNMNGQQQQQQPPQQQGQHQPNPDFILSQMNHQNLQQSAQGFGHHNMNLQNGLMNQQQQQPQTSPAQVFSHTNWLNSEQNMYMNNLSNGFTNFNDKFSIPLPPGFQNQKSECIN